MLSGRLKGRAPLLKLIFKEFWAVFNIHRFPHSWAIELSAQNYSNQKLACLLRAAWSRSFCEGTILKTNISVKILAAFADILNRDESIPTLHQTPIQARTATSKQKLDIFRMLHVLILQYWPNLNFSNVF